MADLTERLTVTANTLDEITASGRPQVGFKGIVVLLREAAAEIERQRQDVAQYDTALAIASQERDTAEGEL